MKIGVWGCYNQGFLCDDLIYKAIEEEIKRQDRTIEVSPCNCNQYMEPDAFIVGGGTIIGDPLKQFSHNGKPYVIFGAGYRETPDINILKRAKCVKTRGELSARKLRAMGLWAESCGDPVILLDVPQIQTSHSVMIPRKPEVNQPAFSWLLEQEADVGIIMNPNEDYTSRVTSLNVKKWFCLNDIEKALPILLAANRITSARLHPFLLGLMLGIPSSTFQFEFDKVDDALSGLGLQDIVTREGFIRKIEGEEQLKLAQEKIKQIREAMQKLVGEILECLIT